MMSSTKFIHHSTIVTLLVRLTRLHFLNAVHIFLSS